MKGKTMKHDMYLRSHKVAFENAITKGLKEPQNYMYMYSKNSGYDYFKNVMDRTYISFEHEKKEVA